MSVTLCPQNKPQTHSRVPSVDCLVTQNKNKPPRRSQLLTAGHSRGWAEIRGHLSVCWTHLWRWVMEQSFVGRTAKLLGIIFLSFFFIRSCTVPYWSSKSPSACHFVVFYSWVSAGSRLKTWEDFFYYCLFFLFLVCFRKFFFYVISPSFLLSDLPVGFSFFPPPPLEVVIFVSPPPTLLGVKSAPLLVRVNRGPYMHLRR